MKITEGAESAKEEKGMSQVKWPMKTADAEGRGASTDCKDPKTEGEVLLSVDCSYCSSSWSLRRSTTHTRELDMLQNWLAVGAHLKLCPCSTDGVRRIVEKIAGGLRDGSYYGGMGEKK